jgi:putative ABC transport system permease protein
VNAVLKREQGRTGAAWGLRGVLVAGQLAISVMLLATGFLFIHNLMRATSMNPGFDIDHAIWTYMRLVPEKYKDQARERLVVDEALQRIRALPGVAAAAITRHVPLNDSATMGTFIRTDLSPQPIHISFEWNSVGPDYFRAMGIPILRGREFSRADAKGGEMPIVINETLARAVFGGRDPVGHTLIFETLIGRIVGVAKDSKYTTLGETQRAASYDPWFASDEPVNLDFIVKAVGSTSGLVKPIQEILGQLDPAAAIETKPMIQALGMALLPSQAGAAMLGSMGMLALVLAATGLYGGLMYAVSRRTREIGIRLALGATPAEVMRVVCRHTAALVGVGMIVGLALAFAVGRPVATFLVPGLSAADPASLLSVVGVLIGVALLATVVPAVRALRVDPMIALRHD